MKKSIILSILLVCLISVGAYAENYFFTNFTAGELTRKLDARVDFDKTFNGARTLENMIVFPQGGVAKRPGTYYVSGVSDSTAKVRLVPFEFSTTQAYILEFGDEYIRFYKDEGQILSGASPYEISTSYTSSDLDNLKFTQSADYLYIASPDHAPAKLTRASHTSWTLSTITFNPPALEYEYFYPSSGVTLSATTGSGVTVEADAVFLEGDIDRQIKFGTGIAVITGYTDTSGVTVDILTDFSGTTAAEDGWYMYGSPSGSLDPDKADPVGAISTLTNSVAAFRTSDVGDYISINDCLYKITSFTSSTIVSGEIVKAGDSHTASTIWDLKGNAWTSDNGYPSCVEFFQERLVWAGTTAYPQTLWMSRVGDYENMTTGSDDDDAITVTIASSQVNAIRWMSAGDVLAIGTTGSEWTLGPISTTDSITPSSIRLKQHTSHGSANIMPVRVGRDLVFVQKSGKKLREFAYDWQADGYVSADLTLLAEHLTSGTSIVQIAYQQEPNGIIWSRLADGNLLGLTYLKAQNVVAWHKQTTNGDIESIATVPGPSGNNQLWMEVARTVSGATVRYIEFMKEMETDTVADMFYVDSGLTYSGSGATTITGLDHLSGCSVAVLADGAYVGLKTVSGGSITLTASATKVQAGLPYTSILETIDLPPGTGIDRRITAITPRFYRATQGSYGSTEDNLSDIDWSESGTTPYTGNIRLPFQGGWAKDQPILIESDEPLFLGISGILVGYQ